MTRRRISSGSAFEAAAAYSRAVVDGDWVHVSGTTGFDYAAMTISPDFTEQARQTFRNIAAALGQAGCSLDDVVRARYYLVDAAHWPALVPVLAEYLSTARPAATCIIAALIDPRMQLEIEVTARLTP